MSFSLLGLNEALLRAVSEQGYEKPSDIQAEAIPTALAGHDVIGSAQTGTGKTAAFALPMLQQINANNTGGPRRVRGLVLVPTRELADQVCTALRDYARHLPLRVTAVYGGMPFGPQIKALRGQSDIVVATPGRLLDHLSRNNVDLSQVEQVVLDEADRMLDMGFVDAINEIFAEMGEKRQVVLFSATFNANVRKLANRYLREPKVVKVAQENSAAESVAQHAYLVDHERKQELLVSLIKDRDWHQVLVFTGTKRGAEQLAKDLSRDGIRATAIHGDKHQKARSRALEQFKHNRVRVLVATDVAARGIDIDRLGQVVNYELPHNPEDYLHRIGRTGRGGHKGSAYTMVSAQERRRFDAVRRLVKKPIEIATIDGFEPRHKVSAKPFENKNRGRGRPDQRNRPRKSFSGRPSGERRQRPAGSGQQRRRA